jgi:hypothetical protein
MPNAVAWVPTVPYRGNREMAWSSIGASILSDSFLSI